MKTTRREFLQTSALATLAATQPVQGGAAPIPARATPANKGLDAFEIARQHAILRDLPSPNFFEGMLLGNGDVGLCPVVRPDALGLHLGKNDCWDIRVSEDIVDDVLPFSEILKLWQRASEEAKRMGKTDMLHLESTIDFFREYTEKVHSSYGKVWPRPWPCGTVWINWDSRWVEPGQQTLDTANGLFTLDLKCVRLDSESRKVRLSCFVDWQTGLVSASTDGPVPVLSIDYYPEVDGLHASSFRSGEIQNAPNQLPQPKTEGHAADTFAEFSAYQYFPALGATAKLPSPPTTDKDRNFSLHGRVVGSWTVEPAQKMPAVSLTARAEQQLRLDIQVATPRDRLLKRLEDDAAASGDRNPWISIPQNHSYSQEDLNTSAYARDQVSRLAGVEFSQLQHGSEAHWREFWSCSAVELNDKELERIWYRNQYFLASCLKKQKVAPGLFANWAAGNIGTAWHGDYHLDYNCQQVFWGVFSSNHADLHLPYVELCGNMMAMSEKFAQDEFGLPGACFPLSAYPVPSQIFPYPAPPWAYQMSLTPWTVQSLWWQYLYTQDENYLRHVYPMLRAAALFIAAYVRKGADQKYHFIPTVSSENWGFTVDYRLNKDCILDITLTQFLLDAVIEGSTILATDDSERTHWQEIRQNLAPYPQARGPYGEVWLDVVNAPAEHVYNVPITLAPVFPAEQVGIGRDPEQWRLRDAPLKPFGLKGGNDLVYQPLIRARLGMLDLDWFKREVLYCSLPNGVANDRVRQTGGRYFQSTDFDFMMRMGVWCENFALPAVLNECMMQSYTRTIRLFPNTTNLGAARFENLRAAGAFLVSATYDGATVTHLSLVSEKGKTARIAAPWITKAIRVIGVRDGQPRAVRTEGEIFAFETDPGERYLIEPAS